MQRSAARSPNRIRRTKGEVVFDTVNYIVLSLLGIITLYPIINVLAISLSSYTGYLQNPAMILPAEYVVVQQYHYGCAAGDSNQCGFDRRNSLSAGKGKGAWKPSVDVWHCIHNDV